MIIGLLSGKFVCWLYLKECIVFALLIREFTHAQLSPRMIIYSIYCQLIAFILNTVFFIGVNIIATFLCKNDLT